MFSKGCLQDTFPEGFGGEQRHRRELRVPDFAACNASIRVLIRGSWAEYQQSSYARDFAWQQTTATRKVTDTALLRIKSSYRFNKTTAQVYSLGSLELFKLMGLKLLWACESFQGSGLRARPGTRNNHTTWRRMSLRYTLPPQAHAST